VDAGRRVQLPRRRTDAHGVAVPTGARVWGVQVHGRLVRQRLSRGFESIHVLYSQVQGRLVRCVPPTAHEEIKNVDQARAGPRHIYWIYVYCLCAYTCVYEVCPVYMYVCMYACMLSVSNICVYIGSISSICIGSTACNQASSRRRGGQHSPIQPGDLQPARPYSQRTPVQPYSEEHAVLYA
jgi:hypothetical protein